MFRSLMDYLGIILALCGSVASIISFIYLIDSKLDSQGLVGIIFLGIFALYFLGYSIYLVATRARRIRYAEIFESLQYAIEPLNEIERESENIGVYQLIEKLRSACTDLGAAYSKVIGANCAICIKMLINKDGRYQSLTIARDRRSIQKSRSESGVVVSKIPNPAYIEMNTGLYDVLRKVRNRDRDLIFFNNKLPSLYGYTNERLDEFKRWTSRPKLGFTLIDVIVRFFYWPLEYKSTIVCPIVPLPLSPNEKNELYLRGFVCADTGKANAFSKKYDTKILRMFSGILHGKIFTLLNKLNEDGEKQKEEEA